MVKQVGRPPERDSEGNVVSKSIVNCTIPTKLRDWLRENNINRSQLFTRVVTMLYCHALCPKCYSENVKDNLFALICDDCETVIKYNNCSECDAGYHRAGITKDNQIIEGNLPIAIKGSNRFGCEVCQK